MYKIVKVQRFELTGSSIDLPNPEADFDNIDNYEAVIKQYIYSDVKYTDHTEPLEKALQSRLQVLMSSILLRSVLLKQGLVSALNDSNFPAYYAVLKSFLEIPAMLGYICYLLHSDKETLEILEKFSQLSLGNREAGSLPRGNVEAINILTMFEKADRAMKDVSLSDESLTPTEQQTIEDSENILLTYYKDVCNFGHINYNAHLSVGILHGDTWKAKTNAEGYKGELYPFYMPAFQATINTIPYFCGLIFKNGRVREFDLLNNSNYFPPELQENTNDIN